MKFPCSGVILAGGLNTRLLGKDKALIKFGDKHLLDYIYNCFISLFDEIILVTNHPQKYLKWDLDIVTDIFPMRSSLSGIHGGLFYSTRPHIFITACDMPFIKKELIVAILKKIDDRMDAIIPETSSGLEPLCAVYAKKSLNAIEKHLSQKKFKIQRVFRQDRIKKVKETVLRKIDPQLNSFFNINRPEDLIEAEKLLS